MGPTRARAPSPHHGGGCRAQLTLHAEYPWWSKAAGRRDLWRKFGRSPENTAGSPSSKLGSPRSFARAIGSRYLRNRNRMTDGQYRQDPLTPEEREEFEEDLVSFCDRELELLGDIRGLDVLYAGGSSLLWIEGLSQRAGEGGTVTALDLDRERVEAAGENLEDADLRAPVWLVAGSVFEPPFGPGTFDLVYSAGLFHELDVAGGGVEAALRALSSAVRPGGRVATGDFVDTVPRSSWTTKGWTRSLPFWPRAGSYSA